MNLTDLEETILRTALAGRDEVQIKLHKQLEVLRVQERDYSGVGFFTEFSSVSEDEKLDLADTEISDIEGTSDCLTNGFGCVVFIKNGQIDTIECFTYDEPWPDQLGSFTLHRARTSGASCENTNPE